MAAPQKNAWSYGLFDCFGDGGICLHVCCCPCCAYGQEMEMFHMGTAESSGCGEQGACCTYVGLNLIPYCGCCLVANYAGKNRTEIRNKFGGLPEECGSDCLAYLCCSCCAQIQEMRELKARHATPAPVQGVAMERN